jgi:hypothetical protein
MKRPKYPCGVCGKYTASKGDLCTFCYRTLMVQRWAEHEAAKAKAANAPSPTQTGEELVQRIVALMPDHPEIMTMDSAWGLFELGVVEGLEPSYATASWALEAAKLEWARRMADVVAPSRLIVVD